MIDDDGDPLGFEDAADKRAAVGAAFIANAKMGPRELSMSEQCHRMDGQPGANEVAFTTIDDETGVEGWDPPTRGRVGEGERWRRIMNWPREPTIAEVMAFQANACAVRVARWWDRLGEARRLDDEFGYDGDLADTKQKPPDD